MTTSITSRLAAVARANWKRLGTPLALLAVGGVVGCTPGMLYLQPAPSATTLPHRRHDAVAEAAGVRLVANGDAWRGDPGNLGRVITPIKVDLHNTSDVPVRVRYREFKISAGGFTSVALPLYRIKGTVNEPGYPVVVPAFTYSGFYLAPYYRPFYDWDFDMWNGPFAYDPIYYDTYYPDWRVSLPTQDMRADGIPEGVLAPGGRLSGFLYFQRIQSKSGPVTLTFDLMNARTGEQLGTVNVPFVAK